MRRSALIAAAMAAAMMPSAVGVMPGVLRERDAVDDAVKLLGIGGSPNPSSPNGGRRHTVAQAQRAARKRRNQLRHRRAMRGGRS